MNERAVEIIKDLFSIGDDEKSSIKMKVEGIYSEPFKKVF